MVKGVCEFDKVFGQVYFCGAQTREMCRLAPIFITRVKEKLGKDETKARKCDINSRTPTWISSDTNWSVC